jgi:Rrf2 family protein
MLELSLSYNEGGVMQKDIADSQEISNKYLDHIIASLKGGGLIFKNPGRNGGYSLSRSPEKISIYDIYKAFDSDLVINDCLLDPEMFEQKKYCSVLNFWDSLNKTIVDYMENQSLADMADQQAKINQESNMLMYYI